jgi:hypothetical protein
MIGDSTEYVQRALTAEARIHELEAALRTAIELAEVWGDVQAANTYMHECLAPLKAALAPKEPTDGTT